MRRLRNKKLLSILMAAALVLGTLPGTVLATEPEEKTDVIEVLSESEAEIPETETFEAEVPEAETSEEEISSGTDADAKTDAKAGAENEDDISGAVTGFETPETDETAPETEAGEEDVEMEDITEEVDEEGIMLLSDTEGEDEEGIMPLATVTTSYVDENGNTKTVEATELTSNTTWGEGWYVVDSDVTISSRVYYSGDMYLILADDCTLTANNGINVQESDNAKLTIYGQSAGTGTLNAYSGGHDAGIGVGAGADAGKITINGGTINATSSGGSGIGCYTRGRSYTIIINGGTVTATTGGGAGIGSASSSQGSFSTGENGHAVIYASSIQDRSEESNWSGIISASSTSGDAVVYGSPVITSGESIPSGKTARIEDGKTVTIASGATLTNYGTLYQDWGSTFTKTGTYADRGTTYYQVKNSFSEACSFEGTVTYSDQFYATEGTAVTASLSGSKTYQDYTVTPQTGTAFTASGRTFTMPEIPVTLSGGTETDVVAIPDENTASFTYNGSEQTYMEDANAYYTVSEGTQENAGTYTVTASLKDKSTSLWEDGTTDDKTYTFTISPKSITKEMFPDIDTNVETYTGSAITKDTSGTDTDANGNTISMTEDTDYTVGYTDNTNAGTATITITGEGNYTGTLTYEFDIQKADQNISYENTELHHLENAHSFTNELTVTTQSTDAESRITYSSSDESRALVDPESGEVNIEATGTVTITATAVETDNFNEATASYTLEIVQPEETVSDDVEKVYDGGDIYLFAEVEHDEELGDAEGLTYTYYWYRNDELIATTSTNVLRLSAADVNVQDGTEYTCAIEMADPYLDEYIHQYQTITITITAKEITEAMFEVNTDEETFTGSEITKAIIGYDPELEVSLNIDVDYAVGYEDNTDAGTATITITGIGNYGGELSYTFVINKAVYDMSGIGFADATYTYNGEAQAVEITGDLPDGVTVSYTDNTRINTGSQTATATFTGDADNYEEIPDMTAELTILEATFGDMAVTATGYSGTYDGEGHTITVELSGNAEGAEVTYGTDGDGEYSDENPAFTDVGTYTVYYKVSKENYEDVTGSLTVEITERTITTDMFDVDTKAKTYTGEPITTSIDSALAEGIDYTVSYEDNTDVGTATITIEGIGNYTGTLTYTFKIVEEEKGNEGSGGGAGGTGGKGNTGTNGTGTGTNGGETTTSGSTGANTADTNAPILYSFLIVLAGAAIVTLGVRRRSARR